MKNQEKTVFGCVAESPAKPLIGIADAVLDYNTQAGGTQTYTIWLYKEIGQACALTERLQVIWGVLPTGLYLTRHEDPEYKLENLPNGTWRFFANGRWHRIDQRIAVDVQQHILRQLNRLEPNYKL